MFGKEKHTRILLGELLCIACVGMTAALLLTRIQEKRMREFLFAHDAAIADVLLGEGVEEQTVAEAMARVYSDTGALAAGTLLLHQIGLSEETDPRLLPELHKFYMPGRAALLLGALLPALLFFSCVFRYLQRQDRIYREAIAAIENCGEDGAALKLPELYDGTLYRLFSRINFMAGMLKTRQEAEIRAKEFLKETVADISHQLKTPLAALSLYQEILRNESGQAQTVELFAEKSGRTIARMEGLILRLLKLTRLDAGSVVFRKKSFRAGELASEAAQELTDRAGKEKKELSFSGEEDARVFCDPEWTKEALSNLIKNALDHTREGDAIRVAWEQTPGMTRFIVEDTGEGIAPEDIHHIFKRFYKSPGGKDSQAAGLGLSLVKSIAEGQGGTVGAKSDAGQGATFVLALPAF